MIKNWTLPKVLPYILIVVGVVGYICAFIIMDDKVKILQNPHYIPSCSLNPVVSCGSVMQSKQAAAFGFPNPFIGLGAYPVIGAIGVAILAGARFKRWFWVAFEVISALGLAFAYWLLFESIYRIKALCPFCLTIDVLTITMFWYLSLYLVDQKHLVLPKGKPQKIYKWLRGHHLDILVLWLLIIIALILKHFWYYYGKHL